MHGQCLSYGAGKTKTKTKTHNELNEHMKNKLIKLGSAAAAI